MSDSAIQSAIEHLRSNRETIIEHYKEFLRFPSISTDPAYKPEMHRCADWLVDEMTRIGLHNCRKIESDGQPVVYGEWLEAGDDRPTLLVYAHYDVQPVDPLELWESPPFEPEIRDGKLYARGSIDDKSGVWANLKVFEAMFATEGKLPVNVKVFFEGEEESGSPTMAPFVSAHKDLLKADAIIISDGGFDPDQPKATYGARGICSARVYITGPDHDLHSGIYGGTVHNPIHMAGRIIGSFHTDEGRVALPGFYDDVKQPEPAELERLQQVWEIVGDEVQQGAGVKAFWGERVASFPERQALLPTLEVNGVWGGYQGEGVKTVLPSRAGFIVSMRLVDNQDPYKIADLFTDHVLSFAVPTLDIEVEMLARAFPFTGAHEGPLVESAQAAFSATTGREVLYERTGGSIPIIGMFQNELGILSTQFSFGAGDGLHSPNEYLIVDHFFTGMETAVHFYHRLAEQMTTATA